MEQEIQIARMLLIGGAFGALGFAMITGMLYTLAMQMNRAVHIHNLIRETKRVRIEYTDKHRRQSKA